MKKLKMVGVITVLAVLSGCKTTGISPTQLAPQNESKAIENAREIIFDLERPIRNISHIEFYEPEQIRRITSQGKEAVGIRVDYNYSEDEILVQAYKEDYISDSVRGSAAYNEYVIQYDIDGQRVTLMPKEHKKRTAKFLIFPKKAPDFSEKQLYEVISTSRGRMDFSIDSEYSGNSIIANFQRNMSKKSPRGYGKFKLNGGYPHRFYSFVPGADVMVEMQALPYRDGSKADFYVSYLTRVSEGEVIDKAKIEEFIYEKINSIIEM